MSNNDTQLRCAPIEHGSPEYAAAVALRNEVLRKPLGLSLSDAQLQAESDDHHLAGLLDGRLVACLVLTPVSVSVIRMRQVAVAPDCRGRGIGKALVLFAERYAADHGFSEMTAHARESALPFYEKLGYTRVGETFAEVGIPHVGIRKSLPHPAS
jgi:predicted GNAT family N-acyltransferase